MAQATYTPIQLYHSTTAAAVPTSGNLANGELALNISDMKLYAKNSGGTVTLLASNAASAPVLSFQTSLGGLTPSTATTGVVTLAGTLNTSSGGTGLTSFTAGDVPYYASGTLLSKLAIGTAGQFLTSSGTAPQWSTLSGVAVTTFSAGTTGFTPSSATSGAVTLAGTLATTNGGTGLTSFTSGGLVYASSTSALTTGSTLLLTGTTLNAVGTNSAFNADGGGVGGIGNTFGVVGTSYGYIGTSTATPLVFNTSNTERMRLDTSGNLGIGTSSPAAKLDVVGSFFNGGQSRTNSTTKTFGFRLPHFLTATDPMNVIGGLSTTSDNLVYIGGSDSNIGGTAATALYFYTAANNTTANGTERFRIASTGAFGLSGANYGTNGQVLTSSGSGAAPTWTTAGGGSQWTTTGSDIYYTTGNVGIGTASPEANAELTVYGSGIAVSRDSSTVTPSGFDFKCRSANPKIGLHVTATAQLAQIEFGTASDNSFGAYINVTGTDPLRFGTSNTERMRITSGGVVGIGNTNPSAVAQRLVLNGPGYGGGTGSGFTGSTVTQYLFDNMGADNGGSVNPVGFTLIGGGGGVPRGFIIGSYGNGRSTTNDSVFFTTNSGSSPFNDGLSAPAAGVYRGTLDATTYAPNNSFPFQYSNGAMTSFGVYDNWSSDYDGTSKAGIQVRLAGGYGGGSPGNWGGACYTASISTNFGSGSTGTNYGYRASISGSGSGNNYGIYIDNGDAAKPGGGSWTSTSDARVKNVNGAYSRGLNDVIQINPVLFTYNGKGNHAATGKEYIGVIAQEIEPVFPEMINRQLTKLNPEDEQETELLMVDNSSLVYALVNSVKELKAELDLAKQRIAALEGA